MADKKARCFADLFKTGTAGIVTVEHWMATGLGDTYQGLWAPVWDIITDKTFPVEGFRSTEHWQTIAYDTDGNILAIVPGCQVKGFVTAAQPPASPAGRGVCNLVSEYVATHPKR